MSRPALLTAVAAALLMLTWVPHRPPAPGPQRPHGRRRPVLRLRSRRRTRPVDLAVLVTEVASRLRSGAPPEAAWEVTVDRLLGAAPVPHPAPEDGVPAPLARLVRHCASDPGAAAAARTVVAASRLTHALGAPLAEVLGRCAGTVTEAEQARDARRVALAGPRSTARILTGLPVLGLFLGIGLGADPLAAATDGGWGTASVVGGLVLLAAGRRWTHALVAVAEQPGTTRRSRRSPDP